MKLAVIDASFKPIPTHRTVRLAGWMDFYFLDSIPSCRSAQEKGLNAKAALLIHALQAQGQSSLCALLEPRWTRLEAKNRQEGKREP